MTAIEFGFILLIIIFLISIWWTNWVGAPWVPTSMKKVRRMLDLAEVKPDDLVIDLGCGDGRIITTAARKYGARAIGIEIDPLRYVWCQLLITVLGLRGRVQIIRGNFFHADLSKADVVTCYLLTSTNKKLQSKLIRELQTNTRIVSHNFTFPKLQLKDTDTEYSLYLYRPVPHAQLIKEMLTNESKKDAIN